MNLMVTINQKPTIDAQKTERSLNIILRKIIKLQGKRLKMEENNREELQ